MSEIAYTDPAAGPSGSEGEPSVGLPKAAEDEPHVELELESESPGSDEGLLSLVQVPFEHLPRGSGVMIRKQPFPVRLCLGGGLWVQGNMFLGSLPDQTAEQALQDFLHEVGNGFFPVQETGGSTSILRAKAVQCFAIPLEVGEPSFSERHRVRIELEEHSELEGTVNLDIDTIDPRVSDLLNVPQTYVSLQTESEVILVQRDMIVRVRDLGRAEG